MNAARTAQQPTARRFAGHMVTGANGRQVIADGTPVIVTRANGQSFTGRVVYAMAQAGRYMVLNTYSGTRYVLGAPELDLDHAEA